MIRLISSLLVLVLGVAAGAGLAACGDEESDARLLPAKNANEIERNLDDVEDLIADCNLTGAEDAVDDVEAQVAKVADRIDPELHANLLQGTELLRDEIAAENCDEQPEPEPVETTETPEAPVEEEPAEEQPPPTEEEPETPEGDDDGEEGEGGGDEGSGPPPAEEPPPVETPVEPPSGGGATPPPSGGVGPGQSAEVDG